MKSAICNPIPLAFIIDINKTVMDNQIQKKTQLQMETWDLILADCLEPCYLFTRLL